MLIAFAILGAAIVAAAAYLARARSHSAGSVQAAMGEATEDPPRAEKAGGHPAGVEDTRERQTHALGLRDLEPGARGALGPRNATAKGLPRRVQGPFTVETQDQLGRYRFDSFVVGEGNRSAYRVARAAAESPGLRFNPLFIYGGPGLGKTHLMCALATEVHERDSDAKVLYLTSQAFAEQILDAYRSRGVEELERQYVRTDVLLIDDIQFLGISQSLQSVVARVLGEMYEQGKQIAVSSDRRPEELRALAEEISSRFATGVIVEVDRPDAALRTRILKRRARLEDWPLEDELIVYVAHSLNGDIRTLEGVATKLVAMKTLQGVRLDKTVVDDVLREVAGGDAQKLAHPRPKRRPALKAEASPVAAEGAPRGHSETGGTEAQPSGAVTTPAGEEEGAVAKDVVVPRHVNPLVREFSKAVPVTRTLGLPSEIASVVPRAGASCVVVLGTSCELVMDAVEAMVGRGSRPTRPPREEPWAYMVHLECDRPSWILLGTSRWNQEDELGRAVRSQEPPIFVVVLDGESPEIANARGLISSVPSEGGMAVIILGSLPSDSAGALPKMLRSLLGVPERFPVLVHRAMDTAGSRTWVRLALESRPGFSMDRAGARDQQLRVGGGQDVPRFCDDEQGAPCGRTRVRMNR